MSGLFCQKLLPRLPVFRIRNACVHRTNGDTLGDVLEADTLGASRRVDHEYARPLADRLVGAILDAGSAGNAIVGYFQGHGVSIRLGCP